MTGPRSIEDEVETLYWVSLPWATFGIVAVDGIVTEAAPIAYKPKGFGKTVGRPWSEVRAYYKQMGADIRYRVMERKRHDDAQQKDNQEMGGDSFLAGE